MISDVCVEWTVKVMTKQSYSEAFDLPVYLHTIQQGHELSMAIGAREMRFSISATENGFL